MYKRGFSEPLFHSNMHSHQKRSCLPRQARDKQKETLTQRGVFLSAGHVRVEAARRAQRAVLPRPVRSLPRLSCRTCSGQYLN